MNGKNTLYVFGLLAFLNFGAVLIYEVAEAGSIHTFVNNLIGD